MQKHFRRLDEYYCILGRVGHGSEIIEHGLLSVRQFRRRIWIRIRVAAEEHASAVDEDPVAREYLMPLLHHAVEPCGGRQLRTQMMSCPLVRVFVLDEIEHLFIDHHADESLKLAAQIGAEE